MNSTALNPLLTNDPLLQMLVGRFALSPGGFALLSLLFLPGALLLWCALTKTLRIAATKDNPRGHGFLTPINLYLIILPYVDYKIFAYYKVYADTIPPLFRANVLVGSPDVVFDSLHSAWARWASLGIILICTALALLAVQWPRITKSIETTWHHNHGRPRVISYYFYICFLGLQGSIVLNWLMRHLLIWNGMTHALNTRHNIYNPDKMFGLSALGDLIWNSYGVMITVTVLVVVWLLGAKLTRRKESILSNPGEVAGLVVLLLAGPLGVLVPLMGTHVQMMDTKHEALQRLGPRINQLSEEIQSSVVRSSLADAELPSRVSALNAENQLYKFVDDCSTWPISSGMITAFVGFLNPIIIPILLDRVKRLFKGHRERAQSG